MNTIAYDLELDARGLNCPLPILKTNQTINKMAAGQVLKVVASDPGSVNDMKAWSRQTENDLLAEQIDGEIFIYYIKKT